MIPAADLRMLSTLCRDRAGLAVDADKVYLVESRLAPIARREGFGAPEDLLAALREARDERLVWAAVEAMALPETSFFRDYRAFEALGSEVLPARVSARPGSPVRVWSAACGAGQEIYSLAMMVADDATLADKVELFASDLSERSLEKAQSGLYSQFEIQRGLPARDLVRHFEKRGEMFAISPRIRQAVRWRRINLIDDLSCFGQFDVVLCRYVLSAMAPGPRAQVTRALAAAVAPGGRLVLGLDEPAPVGLRAMGPGIFAAEAEAVSSAA